VKVYVAEMTREEEERDLNLIYGLGKIMGGTIIADLFLVLNDILVMLTATTEELHVAHLILAGRFAPLFVGVELVLGSLIPLFLVFHPKTGRSLRGVVIASLLVMIGIFAMRCVVVLAGQYLPLH
jgi:molybdopterin-containing oxidoreductase family membrane subunit